MKNELRYFEMLLAKSKYYSSTLARLNIADYVNKIHREGNRLSNLFRNEYFKKHGPELVNYYETHIYPLKKLKDICEDKAKTAIISGVYWFDNPPSEIAIWNTYALYEEINRLLTLLSTNLVNLNADFTRKFDDYSKVNIPIIHRDELKAHRRDLFLKVRELEGFPHHIKTIEKKDSEFTYSETYDHYYVGEIPISIDDTIVSHVDYYIKDYTRKNKLDRMFFDLDGCFSEYYEPEDYAPLSFDELTKELLETSVDNIELRNFINDNIQKENHKELIEDYLIETNYPDEFILEYFTSNMIEQLLLESEANKKKILENFKSRIIRIINNPQYQSQNFKLKDKRAPDISEYLLGFVEEEIELIRLEEIENEQIVSDNNSDQKTSPSNLNDSFQKIKFTGTAEQLGFLCELLRESEIIQGEKKAIAHTVSKVFYSDERDSFGKRNLELNMSSNNRDYEIENIKVMKQKVFKMVNYLNFIEKNY